MKIFIEGQECLSISIKEIIKETKEAEEDKLRKEASLSCQFHHSRLTQLLGNHVIYKYFHHQLFH